jgi:hypothetical protein
MFRALVLGAVQGLTEFVPVSSSAHLVLVPFLLGWPIPSLSFDVAIHLGTLLALMVYFWRDLRGIVAGVTRSALRRADGHDRANGRLALLLVIGSVPAGRVGILLEGFFEGELKRAGPRLTLTLCRSRPVQTQRTFVPFETVTVGTPLARTNQLSPTLTRFAEADGALVANAADATATAASTMSTSSLRTGGPP